MRNDTGTISKRIAEVVHAPGATEVDLGKLTTWAECPARPSVSTLVSAMTIEIIQEPTQFNDWAELLALLQQAFAYQAERIDPPSSLNKLDAQGLAGKAGEERLFLAVEDGQVIGCIFAKLKADAVYVGKLAVLPSRQGQGIGRKLMQAVEVFANGAGRSILELETRIELTENHQTFAALGFSKVAEHAHAGYNRSTFITMRKMLPHA